MNRHAIYVALQIGGWLLYALVQIATSYMASDGITPKRIIFLLVEAFLCLIATHGFRIILIRWKWLYLPMHKLIPRVFVAVFSMGLMVYFLRIPVNLMLGRLFNPSTAFDIQQILGQSSFYFILFFLWTVFYFTHHYFDRYNKSLKYEASMIGIELNNLKSQLNPHFIFNALNSIRALVDENPKKSKQAINQLSNILRNSLATEKKGLTKFEDELKIVKDYLGLESIRFEERLKTEFDIHPDSQQFLVPPLMIQTLVENGIKHGISKLTQGGIIQLKTDVVNHQLRIHIRNSGHMVNGVKRSQSGLGLKNTVQRLKLIYGDDASFKIVNENNNFVLTELVIPQNNSHESINRR
ncbi:MAG: histidine kinase [Cyclobacteriaceae bacterium]|nr:histidine kinase [Cyclobacteriaceae bacterium]MDH4295679.1 histidine kinase [Cyclobacteriaceae bacterium]MDH5247488.1 histidine kinase [Cyclobacteriaceae bacterium]